MFKNHLLMAWRSLRRHTAYSTVMIAGLAIGMAGCLIIAFWVRDERNFDDFHEKGARIHRIVSDWTKYQWDGMPGTPSPLGESVQSGLPEVEWSARIAWEEKKVFRFGDKAFYENRGIIVDPAFFDILTFPLVRGKGAESLSGPEDILVTEALAAKYFGRDEPVGKTLDVEGRPWVVRGVLKNIPRTSTFQFDYAHSFQYIDRLSGLSRGWGAFNFSTILLLKSGADPAGLGTKITEIARMNKCPQVVDGAQFRLQHLADIHLSPQAGAGPGLVLGDASAVLLFSAVAVFVLIIACINFVNLSTARLGLRTKEVGLRKTVGAGRGSVIRRFFGESLLLVGASAALALGLVALMIPAFNRLSGKTLSLDLLRPETLAVMAAVIGLTGIGAGLYPALVLSSIRPVSALKRELDRGRKGGRLRKLLVAFQFALSLTLLISTVVVVRQFRFMMAADPGFVKEDVVQIPVKGDVGKSYAAFKSRLLQDPSILAVSGQAYSFAESTWRSSGNFDWEGRDPANNLDMVYTGVDYGYFETMKMSLLQGRDFSRDLASDSNAAVILNETAIRRMGIKDPLGKRFSASKDEAAVIIGVVADARFRSFQHEVDPCVFYIANPASNSQTGLVVVRIDGGKTTAALEHIRKAWGEFSPATPFEYRFLIDTYAGLYRSERRMAGVFRAFAGMGIFVAVLGLLGLAAFMSERRTREIGIRKVLGASAPGIVALMSGEMTRSVLAANLVAWPAGYFAARSLLKGYAYRVDLTVWNFVLPALAVLALAFAAVGLLSLRAANADPVKALRYE
ncbi:MAG: ABC transporter permease [Candidatus Aminicenantes bacterium]|nr:ABC transporter permease [Candidatus Aminicenantes bacterium]